MEKEKVIDPETGEEVVNSGEEPETPEVEEPTPPEKEEGKEEPPKPQEGVKPDVDEFGVPWKNRAMEFQRKFGELQAKVQELEETGKQKEADELEGVLKEIEDSQEPITPAQLRKITNAIGTRVTKSVARIIAPMFARDSIIEAQIDRLKLAGNFEGKAESIVRAKLRQVPPEALVADPEGGANAAYDMALGELARKGQLSSSKQTKRAQTPGAPSIESPGVVSRPGKKEYSEEQKRVAEERGIPVEESVKIEQRREKRKEEREKALRR